MKKLLNPYKRLVLLAFTLAPLLSMANDGDNVEKKRTISKTYNVGPDDRLSIENSFGNVTVSTWDKNMIQVDIEIGVNASSDEKAQRMMDEINVTDHQGGRDISFKTDIRHMSGRKKTITTAMSKFYGLQLACPLKMHSGLKTVSVKSAFLILPEAPALPVNLGN
jgi:hypothetical protein